LSFSASRNAHLALAQGGVVVVERDLGCLYWVANHAALISSIWLSDPSVWRAVIEEEIVPWFPEFGIAFHMAAEGKAAKVSADAGETTSSPCIVASRTRVRRCGAPEFDALEPLVSPTCFIAVGVYLVW
jgi:hypothetical protein